MAYYALRVRKKLDDLSPVSHMDADRPPTFVAWAEFENALIDAHCAELVHRLGVAKRRTPPVMWLKGHNHTSSIADINTSDEMLGRAILEFMSNCIPAQMPRRTSALGRTGMFVV